MWLVLARAYWKVTRREGQCSEAKVELSYTTVRPSQNGLTGHTIAFGGGLELGVLSNK